MVKRIRIMGFDVALETTLRNNGLRAMPLYASYVGQEFDVVKEGRTSYTIRGKEGFCSVMKGDARIVRWYDKLLRSFINPFGIEC